ncbi:Sulfatase modifying factor 1 precursor (C-alpha-formyglycine- generating enzyme 1) [hydrothermal vent metagenome]|uniref:Sulfatase modifying factor 1 (C-alpha-formyglycine- generating enzyme 1) n=1 Tax=hydrothermal vent metagenome TaxID=652676 RepID=A0A3B0ZDE0_9ZZZZ
MKITNFNYLAIFLVSFSVNTVFSAEVVLVPAGSFHMGCSINDAKCDVDEGSVGGTKVNVPAFKIDKNEVTVSEYEQCISSGKCNKPKDFKRNKYCNLNAPNRAKHPINCIDWQDAQAYCKTKSGRLPYEAEWEKAARAGDKTAYPTGNSIDCKTAIHDDNHTAGSVKGEFDGCGEDRTWAVASRKANSFGLFDMHGNAGEWTANWYEKNAITALYAKGMLSAPKSGNKRVVRGGSWDENTKNLRNSYRNVKQPDSANSVYGSIGFRCAYDVK